MSDGISGRDRLERYLLIQAISPRGDTYIVMTDSLGRFEIDPGLMGGMRGKIYLKPMDTKPKSKLTIDNPFETIDTLRQGRCRYLSQNQIFEIDSEDPVLYYDPETTLLVESIVKAKRRSFVRDKVTGYLDSLALLSSNGWVCEHNGYRVFLNDYLGYSHHPEGHIDRYPPDRRVPPKPGESYMLVKYEPVGPNGEWILTDQRTILYTAPQYTEEELLEMNGMWKAQGYYPKREFYEPDEIELATPTPDYRNLLQWKPAVLTDENGVAEITFEASDVNTEFIGIIEAVDGSGLIGAQKFTFRVYKF